MANRDRPIDTTPLLESLRTPDTSNSPHEDVARAYFAGRLPAKITIQGLNMAIALFEYDMVKEKDGLHGIFPKKLKGLPEAARHMLAELVAQEARAWMTSALGAP